MADLAPLHNAQLLLQEDLASFQVNTMGGSGGPVDVDVTLFLYLAIFFLMWFALHNLVFKPYLAVRERREQGTGGNLAEAQAMKEEAEETLKRYESAMEEAQREATQLRNSIRQDGAKAQKERLEAAYAQAAEDLKTRREAMTAQVDEARKELRQEADSLAKLIVQRLLPS